jgi:predicted DNA-binding transcriptional regulator YafY
MATINNPFTRYKVLDNCFRNTGKEYFIEDLIEECEKALSEIDPNTKGISRKQIFNDIRYMESVEGGCIELKRTRVGKKITYRYTDTNFSINKMPLNEIEIANIQSAIKILSQFKGLPQFDKIDELIPKLKQGINLKLSPEKIIEFESNVDLKGRDFLGELFNAIFYKKVLTVIYKPFNYKEAVTYTFHPYYLKQYNNRWFVFGLNPEEEQIWNLALDRIISIKITNIEYIKNTQIDWFDYFEEMVGVTRPIDKKSEKIKMHYYGQTGDYIKTKPLHVSQNGKWIDDNVYEATYNLIINYEFERLVFSFGEQVKVISPESLQMKIKQRLIDAQNLYQD